MVGRGDTIACGMSFVLNLPTMCPLMRFFFQFKLFLIKIIALEQSSRENLKIVQQSTTSNVFIIVFGRFYLWNWNNGNNFSFNIKSGPLSRFEILKRLAKKYVKWQVTWIDDLYALCLHSWQTNQYAGNGVVLKTPPLTIFSKVSSQYSVK